MCVSLGWFLENTCRGFFGVGLGDDIFEVRYFCANGGREFSGWKGFQMEAGGRFSRGRECV